VSPIKSELKNRLNFHEWLDEEINSMISQKNEKENFRQKQLQEEKKQIHQQYEKLKSDFNSKASNVRLSIFEKIKQIFK
jgi:hypothetical protein